VTTIAEFFHPSRYFKEDAENYGIQSPNAGHVTLLTEIGKNKIKNQLLNRNIIIIIKLYIKKPNFKTPKK
jgi:hypothetical protein